MLGNVSVLRASLLVTQASRCLNLVRGFSFRADNDEGPSEIDLKIARQWLSSYSPDTIPRRICDIGFSRSSGPGGQNVNKLVASYECCRVEEG